MKIEYVDAELDLCDVPHDLKTPVVRLAEVDDLLREAVWAMELVMQMYSGPAQYARAEKFLASPAVAEWREREEWNKEENNGTSK